MYASLDFNAKDIFAAVLYKPYWFMYSIVDDEKKALDGRIAASTRSLFGAPFVLQGSFYPIQPQSINAQKQ